MVFRRGWAALCSCKDVDKSIEFKPTASGLEEQW
jgi:hypothetical protein